MTRHSLRSETYDELIAAHQTSTSTLTEGERLSVSQKAVDMILNSAPPDIAARCLVRLGIPELVALKAVQVEYPQELQAARRAEFVRRVNQVNSRVSG